MNDDLNNIFKSTLNDKLFFTDEIKDVRGQLDHLFFKINILEVSLKNKRLETKFNILLDMLNTWYSQDVMVDKFDFIDSCERSETIQLLDEISHRIAVHLYDISAVRAKVKDWKDGEEIAAELKALKEKSADIFQYTYDNLIKGGH